MTEIAAKHQQTSAADAAIVAALGARSTTTPRFTRHEFVPWLRRLHYTLLLKRTGMLLVGAVAVVWLLDCFVAAALTLPRQRRNWRNWNGIRKA